MAFFSKSLRNGTKKHDFIEGLTEWSPTEYAELTEFITEYSPTDFTETANANGGTLRGCTCLRSALPLARARSAPTEQEMHQQSKSCTLCECVKTTMNEESAVLCPVRASSSFDITPRVSASEIVSFSMLRRSFTAGILAVAVSASTTATIVLAAFMIEEYFFSLGSSGSSILSSTEFTTLITALQ